MALFRLEQSRDVEGFRQQVIRLMANPHAEEDVRTSVYAWLTQVLMPLRFPDLPLSDIQSLEEVPTMLAERAREWTLEWKEEGRQEGLAEGRQEGIRMIRELLLSQIGERFGPVPEPVRLRIEAITDLKELKSLGERLVAAGSMADIDF